MKKVFHVAGGGTGGHVLAGLSVIETWKAKFGENTSFRFIGAEKGLEVKLVPLAKVPLTLLKVGGINRVGVKKLFLSLVKLPWSLLESTFLLLREKPDAVLGVGGYASGPYLLMASFLVKFWGGKTAVLEQNSVPGLTNRWLGKVVDRVFTAFPEGEKYFSAKKTMRVGNPIRNAFSVLPPAKMNPFTLFIFGGSQGAIGLNDLILESLPEFSKVSSEIRIIHQTGERDYERVKKAYEEFKFSVRVEKFIQGMKEVYEDASLVICRAGSSSIFELARVGRASILVPLPTASDDHQTRNAKILNDLGGAILFLQGQGQGIEFFKQVDRLRRDESQIRSLEKAIRAFDSPEAGMMIVQDLVQSHKGIR